MALEKAVQLSVQLPCLLNLRLERCTLPSLFSSLSLSLLPQSILPGPGAFSKQMCVQVEAVLHLANCKAA